MVFSALKNESAHIPILEFHQILRIEGQVKSTRWCDDGNGFRQVEAANAANIWSFMSFPFYPTSRLSLASEVSSFS